MLCHISIFAFVISVSRLRYLKMIGLRVISTTLTYSPLSAHFELARTIVYRISVEKKLAYLLFVLLVFSEPLL